MIISRSFLLKYWVILLFYPPCLNQFSLHDIWLAQLLCTWFHSVTLNLFSTQGLFYVTLLRLLYTLRIFVDSQRFVTCHAKVHLITLHQVLLICLWYFAKNKSFYYLIWFFNWNIHRVSYFLLKTLQMLPCLSYIKKKKNCIFCPMISFWQY